MKVKDLDKDDKSDLYFAVFLGGMFIYSFFLAFISFLINLVIKGDWIDSITFGIIILLFSIVGGISYYRKLKKLLQKLKNKQLNNLKS